MPNECSRGKSQDEGEEEDKKPSGDHDDDAHTEEEEDGFDSGDEEILTKSGWEKRTFGSTLEDSHGYRWMNVCCCLFEIDGLAGHAYNERFNLG